MTLNFKNSIYPQVSLYEGLKINQNSSWKKELREIGEEAIWESRFTCFFFIVRSNVKISMYARSFLCEEAKIKQAKHFLKARTI